MPTVHGTNTPDDDHIVQLVQDKLCNISCARRESELVSWVKGIESKFWFFVISSLLGASSAILTLVVVLIKMSGGIKH